MSVEKDLDHFTAASVALEFNKVLAYIASLALSQDATREILALRPLANFDELNARLEEITEMRGILDADEAFPIDSFPELTATFKRLQISGLALDTRQLIELTLCLGMARRVRAYLLARRTKYFGLSEIAQHLSSLQDLERLVESKINYADGTVKDSASPALGRIRKEIVHAMADAREVLRRIARTLAAREMLQEEAVTMREGRLVLMLKDEHRNRVAGLIHDESASGRTVFIEPMESVALNNRIRQLQSAEREEIERILLELSERFRQVLPALQENHRRLVQIDAIHAKARASRFFNAHAPQAGSKGLLRMLRGRHPLLLLRNTDEGGVVPLELELGSMPAGSAHRICTLIISGPNAGGKTVALKTVGLLALMATSGLHVPADPDSEIPHFKNVFVDIGDRQSIEEDLSTFTSHMARLVDILRRAGKDDLVLIDEIGVGTDPEAGAALAMAILGELNRRQCLSVATTHHGVLKVFAQSEPGMINGSMAFDQETLAPTYHFRAGMPGASYAFEIAERMGLDQRLVRAARQAVGSDKSHVETLLADLQASLQEQRRSTEKLNLETTRLTGLRKLYEERTAQLKAQERKLKEEAVAKAEAILQNANATLENAVREIRSQAASREAIKSARAAVASVRQQVAEERAGLSTAPAKGDVAPQAIEPGMKVKWLRQNASAIVVEPPDASQKVLIRAGNLHARVPLEELANLAENQTKRADSLPQVQTESTTTLPEIDLRGMRVEEALSAVDKFLDDALLAGWNEVRLIHGKGTGALRESITKSLKNYRHVKKYRSAAYGEGDLGVTIVELS